MSQIAIEPQSGPPVKTLAGNGYCVVAMLLFAIGFPAAEVLLQTWGPISLTTARVALACGLLLPIWGLIDGWQRVKSAPWLPALAIGGLGFGTGTVLLLVVQDVTDPVTAALVAATMPVSAVAMEILFDGRRLTRAFLAGAVLVLIGGYPAAGAGVRVGQVSGLAVEQAAWSIGVLFRIIATVLFAWGSRATVKSLPGMTTLGQATATMFGALSFCIVTLVVFLAFGWSGTQSAPLGYWGWSMMIVYALGATAISQVFWIFGVRWLGIGIASFHLNAVPFYVMLVLLAAGGTWDWNRALGAAILGGGVILAQRRR